MKKSLAFVFFAWAVLLSGCAGREEQNVPEPLMIEGQVLEGQETELKLQGSASPEELRAVLEKCESLDLVRLESCAFTPEEQKALRADYPAVCFDWPLMLGGQEFRSTDKELDFSRADISAGELADTLALCTGVEKVELGARELSIEEAETLHEAAPDTLFRYDTDFYGLSVSTDAEEIDISGIAVEDVEALERELVRFPRLKKVVMCECGPDDETMDTLNKRHEDIRFVWMVQIYDKGIRTDQDYFINYNCEKIYPSLVRGCTNLRYCPDLVAVDIGHFFPTNEDLEFLYSTPRLKYLVAIEGLYTDITPMGSLSELEYLEMFSSQAEDLSPLLNCKQLKHLNISRCTKLDESCIEVLCQMKQLERLWFCGSYLSGKYEQILQEALPDTEIHFVPYQNGFAPYSMDFGWRKHESYYAMRDALHMYYMDNMM